MFPGVASDVSSEILDAHILQRPEPALNLPLGPTQFRAEMPLFDAQTSKYLANGGKTIVIAVIKEDALWDAVHDPFGILFGQHCVAKCQCNTLLGGAFNIEPFPNNGPTVSVHHYRHPGTNRLLLSIGNKHIQPRRVHQLHLADLIILKKVNKIDFALRVGLPVVHNMLL